MSAGEYTLLVVDDEESIRMLLRHWLRSDYTVLEAGSVGEARKVLAKHYVQLILLDLDLPDSHGLEFLSELRGGSPETEVVVITVDRTADSGVTAMKLGARDYLTKPFSPAEVRQKVRELADRWRTSRRLEAMERSAEDQDVPFIAECPPMQKLMADVQRVAPTGMPVLLEGETGTGKDLIARSIHRLSPVADGPLVSVNCSAIPETLVESELFGHEKGAFTGAADQRRGRFELACGGTLFLDEICSMPLEMQAKLLRVLEEEAFFRVGGSKPIPARVRVVAAANRSLQELMDAGTFRADLYYRIAAVHLRIPPLRERGDDLRLLAAHFLKCAARDLGKPVKAFSPAALSSLQAHAWPGNVRELEHMVRRLVLMTDGEEILDLHDGNGSFPLDELMRLGAEDAPPSLKEAQQAFRKRYVEEALRRCNGNVQEAADLVGVHRNMIARILKCTE